MSRVIEWVVISINTPHPPTKKKKKKEKKGNDLYFKIEVLGQYVNHA